MKSFTHKLLASICAIGLIISCASVTDAGFQSQPQNTSIEQIIPQPDNTSFGSDEDMSPILDRPPVNPDDEEESSS